MDRKPQGYGKHIGMDVETKAAPSAPPALQSNQEWIRPYMGVLNVNVGCGFAPIDGFRNLKQEQWWLGEYSAPFRTDSVDLVLASHVMEHVQDIIAAMREIHRVLRPGGHFIAITPYASSDDAFEDPTHVRSFTELSWHYFNSDLYAKSGHAGHYESRITYKFEVVQVALVPYPEFANDPELEFKKRHWRNVIRELHAVLRKVN